MSAKTHTQAAGTMYNYTEMSIFVVFRFYFSFLFFAFFCVCFKVSSFFLTCWIDLLEGLFLYFCVFFFFFVFLKKLLGVALLGVTQGSLMKTFWMLLNVWFIFAGTNIKGHFPKHEF